MAVIITLGDNKDLVFIDFQLFPRPEGRNGFGPLSAKTGFHQNTWEYAATILYQVSLQEAIASARLQLCAVAIKSFSFQGTFCFQRLKVATIFHCLNHFLPTRGRNSHVRDRCEFVKRSHWKYVPYSGKFSLVQIFAKVPFPLQKKFSCF